MPKKWETFVDDLKDTAGVLAKAELESLVFEAKADRNEFIKKQGVKLERYLNQLASGKITEEQFLSYMEDIRDLTKMQALKMRVAAKASAQRLAAGIEKLIINGLMRLL